LGALAALGGAMAAFFWALEAFCLSLAALKNNRIAVRSYIQVNFTDDMLLVVSLTVSKTYLMAWSLWALRTSGFWLRLAKISVRDAPTMARWNFWVFLVFFLASSSICPFLCLRLISKKEKLKQMKGSGE
jgi:hypothetical protein